MVSWIIALILVLPTQVGRTFAILLGKFALRPAGLVDIGLFARKASRGR
jgi:hypothetical protein